MVQTLSLVSQSMYSGTHAVCQAEGSNFGIHLKGCKKPTKQHLQEKTHGAQTKTHKHKKGSCILNIKKTIKDHLSFLSSTYLEFPLVSYQQSTCHHQTV